MSAAALPLPALKLWKGCVFSYYLHCLHSIYFSDVLVELIPYFWQVETNIRFKIYCSDGWVIPEEFCGGRMSLEILRDAIWNKNPTEVWTSRAPADMAKQKSVELRRLPQCDSVTHFAFELPWTTSVERCCIVHRWCNSIRRTSACPTFRSWRKASTWYGGTGPRIDIVIIVAFAKIQWPMFGNHHVECGWLTLRDSSEISHFLSILLTSWQQKFDQRTKQTYEERRHQDHIHLQ